MHAETIVSAILLGLVEGLTEFIPVSSTAHLLLLGHFIGFESAGRTFEVLIQLGAVLAILVVYFHRLWSLLTASAHDAAARRFILGILAAFLPAAVAGVLLHGFIKTVLFETPLLICTSLIVGGVALLAIDHLKRPPRFQNAYRYPIWLAFAIGCCQVAALVPGVSRSGATIAGALLLGTDKRSAAEFSFFLALPTMAGAFAYDLYKNRDALSMDDAAIIAIGFAAAFVSALVVVRTLLNFVSRHGFAPFAWWRIAVGTLGIIGLLATGSPRAERPAAGGTATHRLGWALPSVGSAATAADRLGGPTAMRAMTWIDTPQSGSIDSPHRTRYAIASLNRLPQRCLPRAG